MAATLKVEPPRSRATTEPLSDPFGRVWVYEGRKVSSEVSKASRKDCSSVSDVDRRVEGLEMLKTDRESITLVSHWLLEGIVSLHAEIQVEGSQESLALIAEMKRGASDIKPNQCSFTPDSLT